MLQLYIVYLTSYGMLYLGFCCFRCEAAFTWSL